MRDIGKNIRTIRQSKEMTQEALADALYVTRQTVSNYENGRSRPDVDMLLKIAEVLETDIHTVIYGPEIPQSKKDSYKRLAVSAAVLAALAALYAAMRILLSKGDYFGWQYSVGMICRVTLIPAMLFAFGWVLLQCLGTFHTLKPLPGDKVKVLRILALTVLALLVLIPIPHVIFLSVAAYRSHVYGSVSMAFPYIPVYGEAFSAMIVLLSKAPFVYALFGSVCWLLGIPGSRKGKQDGEEREDPEE